MLRTQQKFLLASLLAVGSVAIVADAMSTLSRASSASATQQELCLEKQSNLLVTQALHKAHTALTAHVTFADDKKNQIINFESSGTQKFSNLAQYKAKRLVKQALMLKNTDPQKMFSLLLKAAKAKYAQAEFIIGSCYHNGIGTPIDYAQAVRWFTKAAKHGIADAQHNLGYCYQKGIATIWDV